LKHHPKPQAKAKRAAKKDKQRAKALHERRKAEREMRARQVMK
jgi:hypothetical protein